MQAVQQLLQQISQGALQDRIFAAHQLAALLETEEAKYRTHVGDPHENPSLRYHYTIGKILAAVKDAEDIYDGIVDSWVVSRSATLEQQVAGLRLVLACLECWMYQYPLTEESLVQKLGTWALAGLEAAPIMEDDPPPTLQALLEEARQTYSLGEVRLAEVSQANAWVQQQLQPV
eukprot:gene10778-10935_t